MIKTVTLQTAKKLKEAGFPQKGDYWWSNVLQDKFDLSSEQTWQCGHGKYFHVDFENEEVNIAAPTAEEVLELLPRKIAQREWIRILRGSHDRLWHITYGHHRKVRDESLAEASAKMWLYLKKNNLL